MKQILIPNTDFTLEKMQKHKLQEKSYIIAVSLKGLFKFQKYQTYKVFEKINNSYAIELTTNNKVFELFVNEMTVDSQIVFRLPLDTQQIHITEQIYKYDNISIHVEFYQKQIDGFGAVNKRIWFECEDNMTNDSLVQEISSILCLINV